jgi:hypothetical protein
MVGPLRRRLPLLPALAALAALPVLAAPTAACPFCSMQGQTLTGEVAGADLVLYGSLANPNMDKDTTDLVIDTVVKSHPWLKKDQKVVKLPKYLPPPDGDYKFLVFCYVIKNERIDPYRGLGLKSGNDVVKYLTGLADVKDKPVGERLKFFFNYLDNSDTEVANDAFKEFANADYKDYKDMAKGLPPEKIAGWLTKDETPSFRFGLYGSLLGHCGKDEDAKVLRDLLENPKRRLSSGVDGVLAGYILLRPKEGWAYARGLMADPKRDFLMRYAALRTTRFFWTYRPDVIDKKELSEGAALLLTQKDIVDLAIDDLRKWEQWDMTDRVSAVQESEAYKELPVVRRAVLKFMLACQGGNGAGANAATAASYVEAQRKKNGQAVAEAEELLKLDGGK